MPRSKICSVQGCKRWITSKRLERGKYVCSFHERKITGLKDWKGNDILIGNSLRTKWGGIGMVKREKKELLILFEDGRRPTILDENCIEHRELRCVDGK